MVETHLEYAVQLWFPNYRKDKADYETIQRPLSSRAVSGVSRAGPRSVTTRRDKHATRRQKIPTGRRFLTGHPRRWHACNGTDTRRKNTEDGGDEREVEH